MASAKYVLEGYSISANSALSMLQVFEFRKVLVTYYVKSIVFYAIKSPKLKYWLEHSGILMDLQVTLDKTFVDLDPVFNMNIDEDFDFRANGITRSSFCNVYLDWIQFCVTKQDKVVFLTCKLLHDIYTTLLYSNFSDNRQNEGLTVGISVSCVEPLRKTRFGYRLSQS